ncbi:MAG: 6-pyruvoyl-tetrahydropterin synthase-related protein [Candidatus Enteromonas sp.]
MLNAMRDDGRPIPRQEKKIWDIVSRILPYVLLFAASFIPFAIFFETGDALQGGDDSLWHRIWPLDLSIGFQNGYFGLNSPSHTLMGNLGLGTYLFYGPLPHYFVAILHTVFPFISINWGLKIMSLATTFAGGVWTYSLCRRICKDDLCALMLGFCFIFSPYRINCILYRAAYPEAVAMSFAPLLFLGVQGLIDQEFKPKTFTCCVLGVSCLILSHPFTALVFILAAAVYLLIAYRWIVPFFHDKKAIIYGVSSVLLVFGLVGWYFFPMIQYLGSGLYNVSDPILMWTNVAHLQGSIAHSSQFSGFLRPGWLDLYNFPNPGNETWGSWVRDYVAFGFFGALGVFLMTFLSRKHYTYLGAVLGAMASLLSLLFSSRQECFLVIPLFAVSLLLIGISKEEAIEKQQVSLDYKEMSKRPEFYWAIAFFLFSFLCVYVPGIWEILPKVFLNAQFAWRFWRAVLFLAIVIVAYLVRPVSRSNITRGGLAILMTMSFLSCMGPIDKRFVNYTGSVRPEPTIAMIQSQKTMGCQNEYVPRVFKKGSGYKSEYPNSLYSEIYRDINDAKESYQFTMEDYLDPAFLEGSGTFVITSLNSPQATFDVVVETDEALVQLPQFYYDGYVLELRGDRSAKIKGEYVDGLVSFRLEKGNYEADLRWVGTVSYQVFSPIFPVAIIGLLALNIVPWALEKRKEKAEPVEGEKR